MKENSSKKKTMGRQKVEIKPIPNKTRLQVTFTKRRGGLFKKASELSVLCGAHIAILVQSPANKVFAFGDDVDSVLNRFETGSSTFEPRTTGSSWHGSRGYKEALARVEAEEKRKEELRELQGRYWWDRAYEGMELYELEEYAEALEGLRGRVLKRVEEIGEKSKDGDDLLGFGDSEGPIYNYADLQALLSEDDFGLPPMFEQGEKESSASSNSMKNSTEYQYNVGDYCCLDDIFRSMEADQE